MAILCPLSADQLTAAKTLGNSTAPRHHAHGRGRGWTHVLRAGQ
eukprot:COSAG01_NODE_58175_length_307_cov_1.942308_1_plen_43_part_10